MQAEQLCERKRRYQKTLLKKVVYGIVINDILKSNELVEAMQIVVVKQALFDVWHLFVGSGKLNVRALLLVG